MIIVGLGNFGSEYASTRHNLGWMIVEKLASDLGVTFKCESRLEANVASAEFEGQKLKLLLPLTYMNESGRALVRVMNYYKCPVEDVLVVVDDMDLEFGKIRFRAEGSSGGHNGLKSIEMHLSSRNYCRLKVGIGRAGEVVEHVLSRFTQEEEKALAEVIKRAVEQIAKWLRKEINYARETRESKSGR